MTGLLIPLIVLATAIGAVAGRRHDRRQLAGSILRVIYWTNLPLIPILVAAAPVDQAWVAVVASWIVLTVLVIGAHAFSSRRFRDSRERAAFELAALWPNTGWLGPPVVVAILGTDALPLALFYASGVSGPFNMAVNATFAASHDRAHVGSILTTSVRRNHYLLPTLAGVAWGLAGLPVNEYLLDVAKVGLLAGAVPVFLALGLVLGRMRLRPDVDVGAALLIRLGIAPSLLLLAAQFVSVPRAFLIQAGMATGLNALVISSEHRFPLDRVVSTIFWGTLIVLAATAAWVTFEG